MVSALPEGLSTRKGSPMQTLLMFRKKLEFVSIPFDQAKYCSLCNAINNSPDECCSACGSSELRRLNVPPTPPDDPGPGPAPAMCALPSSQFELLRRAA